MKHSHTFCSLLLIAAVLASSIVSGCASPFPVTYVQPPANSSASLEGRSPNVIRFFSGDDCRVVITHIDGEHTGNVTDATRVRAGSRTVQFVLRGPDYNVAVVRREFEFSLGRSYRLTAIFRDRTFRYRLEDVSTLPVVQLEESSVQSYVETPRFTPTPFIPPMKK